MRLDLFLKQSGLIKRRTVAKAMCDADKINRNGNVARAGDDIRRNDILRIDYGFKTTELEILEIPPPVLRRTERREFYQVLKEERDEEQIRVRIAQNSLQRDEPIF